MKKRPHTLTFTWGDLSQDSSTGFMTPVPAGSYSGEVGIFPNQKGRTVSVGGVALDYTFLITLDTGSEIPKGAKVTIEGKEFQVIERMEWQTHAEIWV